MRTSLLVLKKTTKETDGRFFTQNKTGKKAACFVGRWQLDCGIGTSFGNCEKSVSCGCRMVCDRCRCGDIHDVKRLVYVASIFSSGSSGLKLSEVVGRSRTEQDHNT